MMIIAFLSATEPYASLVASILEDESVRAVLSTITLSESVVRTARSGGMPGLETVAASLYALPNCAWMDLDRRHALETARVRSATGLRLPDAAVVATARLANACALIGNDRQWRGKDLGVPYHHMDDLLAPQ